MEDVSEIPSPSSSKGEKTVVVRVKRKATQMPIDAFWLEINERPLKRTLLDFGSLSISGSSAVKEDLKTKKLLVQHVETVSSSTGMKNVLPSFMPNSADAKEFRMKLEERRCMFKEKKSQEQVRAVARQKHEDLVRNARFEQLWKSRKGNKESVPNPFHKLCHLYDVVRVDTEEEISSERQELNYSIVENETILCNYMPLLREFLPTAAAEIESDMRAHSSQQDGYVYDFYTVGDDLNSIHDDLTMYPLVHVDDDDDYYAGPTQSEYESEDSNDEDNPRNDYPDEESSEDGEHDSRSSQEQSEHEELESRSSYDYLEQENHFYGDEVVDDNSDEVEWKWGYR